MSPLLCELQDWRAPDGAEVFWLEAPGKPRLRAVVWRRHRVRGTIMLFGGRTEFIEKYFEVIGEFLGRGFAVAALDWQGQGLSDRLLSDPRRGHVEDFADYESDADRFFEQIAPMMPGPYLVFAHSMGGNVLLRAARRQPDRMAGLILTAPLLGIDFSAGIWGPGIVSASAWAMNIVGQRHRYVLGGGPQAADEIDFENNRASADPRRYAIHQALVRHYPQLGIGSVTYGWLRAALLSNELVSQPDYLAHIELPILTLLAEDDLVVDNDEARFSLGTVDHGRLVTIPNAYHEIMMDRDTVRELAWSEIDAFLEQLL